MKDNLVEFADWWKSVYKEHLAAVYIDERFTNDKRYEMNVVIKQLADEARAWVNDTNNVAPDIEYVFYKDAYDQKFAELIVAECMTICNQAILQNQDTLSKLNTDELAEKMIIHGAINQAQKLGKGIKQHFGVEE